MDDTSIPSLGRADSGGSASSASSSSSSTLSSDDAASRCSSLFSSADTTASDGERRSSFASSVFADDDEDDDDEACKNQAQAQAANDDDATPTASEESTPSPGPLRMSLSRSISSSTTASTSTSNSDDNSSSSSSSHGSFISTTNMATPTAELYALSLHPISPPSTSARTSGLASTTATGDQVVATATSSASSNEGQQGPHYVEGTNNSIIASNNKGGRTTTGSAAAAAAAATKSFIPATSPDMLRFAARVASRGIPFTSPQNKRSHSLQLPASAAAAASTIPGTTTSSSASPARPSSSRGLPGKVLNAEGFPWTARPSSYTPRCTPSSSQYYHNNDQSASSSTSRSRPSTSSGSSSGNTRYASSFGGTPSTIFASFEEDDDDNIIENQSESEDEMEALSEFFPSSFSSGKSHSRPVTRHGNSSSTTTTTKYESSFSSMQYRDNTAHATSSSQSGAITWNTAPGIRHALGLIADEQVQGGKVGQLHDGPVSTASNLMSQASLVHCSDSDSLTRTEKETGKGNQRGTRPEYIDNSEIRSDQHQARHSSTPPLVDDFRSLRGAPESLQSKPSCEKTSSSSSPSAPLLSGTKIDSTHASSVPTSSIGSASTSSLFSSSEERYHPTRFDTNTISASTRSSRSPTQSPDPSSPSSPFRYEAPSSSSAMAAATATMTLPQQQVSPLSRAASSPPPMLSITTSASPRQNANTTSKAIDASTYATSISSPLATRNVENAEVLIAAQDDVVSAGVNSNRHATQGRTASLDDYGRDLKHGASSSSYGVHLNSLNYQAGSGSSAYSSSRPSTNTSSSSSAYLPSMQNNNYNGCALGSATTRTWSRPWVKDSDTSSIKSSSALSSDGSRSSFENSDREPSVMSPAAPLHVPFLSTAPAPPGCKIIVEALQPDGFDIFITLPGFSHENITLALKKSGALHVLADKYDEDSHGHFERMVELGEPAKDCKVTAVFNGDIVEVHVRKLPKEEIVSTTSISNWSYPSSASSTSSSLYKSIGSYSPSMYHGGTDPVAFYSSSPLLAGASYMAK